MPELALKVNKPNHHFDRFVFSSILKHPMICFIKLYYFFEYVVQPAWLMYHFELHESFGSVLENVLYPLSYPQLPGVEAVEAMSSPNALNGRPVAAAVPWRDNLPTVGLNLLIGCRISSIKPYFQVIWGLEWAIRILIYQPDYQYNGMSRNVTRVLTVWSTTHIYCKCFSRHHGVFPCLFQACRVVSKCNVMAYDIHTILIWV